MNDFFKIVKTSYQKKNFLVLVLFVLFSGSNVFAQKLEISSSKDGNFTLNQSDVPVDTTPTRVSSGVNSNLNFIFWFMCTKENVNSIKSSNDTYNAKKSIMTSGREPNHLLMKTLLKKAINVESC